MARRKKTTSEEMTNARKKAAIDAAHVAIAAIYNIPFLLTWNCTHLANAIMRPHIESVCRDNGVRAPIICTPEELTVEDPT